MEIGNFEFHTGSGRFRSSARVRWEQLDHAASILRFDVPRRPDGPGGPSAEACLLACFPLAVQHRETRIRIAAPVCPMLVEGLHTVHGWWRKWGLVEAPMPKIEAEGAPALAPGRTSTLGFLSGGVDSLHMLLRNRKLYGRGDPAYIGEALVIRGFDIGKRADRPEESHFEMTMARLTGLAAALDVDLLPCSTNLRHLPSRPGVWSYLHHGAALAAVAHAATGGPARAFLAASFDVAHMTPWGSHPLVDPYYSSQRLTMCHEGTRFSRLAKVAEIAESPSLLASLRVCPANVPGRLNCGECEKCLRTRLELLATGHDHTPAFGPSAMPAKLLEGNLTIESDYQRSYYEEVLALLEARGFRELARIVARKLTAGRRAASA
jgi:hypothetical protein